MNFRTIEEGFEYQVKEILQSIFDDYRENDDVRLDSFDDWLWENKEILGEYFYEKIDSYKGIVEAIEEIKY